MEFDCRFDATAASLSLCEPMHQGAAAYYHFGQVLITTDGITLFERENSEDLTKHKTMIPAGVVAALKDRKINASGRSGRKTPWYVILSPHRL